MIKAAVLGSPISHSLSPALHSRAFEILGISGEYTAIETTDLNLAEVLARGIQDEWNGFNLTMPLKESIFSSPLCDFDASSRSIRSANTLVREKKRYRATSTDKSAFERLLAPYDVAKVAIIGGGGTARAAVGAIAARAEKIDLLLRTPDRAVIIREIAPTATVNVIPMNSSLSGYDLVINTSPAGVADHLSQRVESVDGLLFESLYRPWPTELSFTWKELGGKVLTGADLLVEQALDAIALICKVDFDYALMRSELLRVALSELNPQM